MNESDGEEEEGGEDRGARGCCCNVCVCGEWSALCTAHAEHPTSKNIIYNEP